MSDTTPGSVVQQQQQQQQHGALPPTLERKKTGAGCEGISMQRPTSELEAGHRLEIQTSLSSVGSSSKLLDATHQADFDEGQRKARSLNGGSQGGREVRSAHVCARVHGQASTL